MYGQARKPFFTADNQSSAHKVVVYRVGEVISGYAVRLDDNYILVVLGYGNIPLYRVAESGFIFYISLRFKSYYEGRSRL